MRARFAIVRSPCRRDARAKKRRHAWARLYPQLGFVGGISLIFHASASVRSLSWIEYSCAMYTIQPTASRRRSFKSPVLVGVQRAQRSYGHIRTSHTSRRGAFNTKRRKVYFIYRTRLFLGSLVRTPCDRFPIRTQEQFPICMQTTHADCVPHRRALRRARLRGATVPRRRGFCVCDRRSIDWSPHRERESPQHTAYRRCQ